MTDEGLTLLPLHHDPKVSNGYDSFERAHSATNLKSQMTDERFGLHRGVTASSLRSPSPGMGFVTQPLSGSDRRNTISINELMKPHKPQPFFQQFLSSRLPINNPSHPDLQRRGSVLDGSASVYSVDFDESQARINFLNSFRPAKLIGNYKNLCNWYEYFNPDYKSLSSKKLRQYYAQQNNLIERFQEIDNFLDSGRIHYNMLSNYGEPGSRILTTHLEEDDSEAPEDSDQDSLKEPEFGSTGMLKKKPSQNTMNSKYSRFYDVPGNVDHDGAQFLGYNEEESNQQVYVAIMVNFFINFLLLVGKIAVSLMTNSISVVASLVDSILDFLSTFIIYIANRLTSQKNWKVSHSYPVGRSRLEPLGVLVFSVIIIISFFQVGQEAFKRLFMSNIEERQAVKIGLDAVSIMLITIFAKIGCWLWCSSSKSSSVQALAQDAMTDIVFNSVSLLMPTVGYMFDIWWLDPLGALLLSVYIIASWSHTAYEHIDNLTGAAADPVDYKVILYLSYRFAESIKQITSLKVYHVGDTVNVEIDLIFAAEEFNLSFKDCHDIAEALQYAIETLPFVERAYVHIDYMEGNFKGHLK